MNHIGLFSGGGGFELVIEANGHNCIAHSEINEFCKKILKYWFPNADDLGNIKETNFKKYANRIDILTGGFPCQPFSASGEQKGIEDDRYLWPEMYRAIREVQPTWVVAENVPGIITLQKGLVFEQVQTDLENEGYKVTSFILPALSVGAIHERTRVWFIAYNEKHGLERSRSLERFNSTNSDSRLRDKLLSDLQHESPTRESIKSMFNGTFSIENPSFATLFGLDDGFPAKLDTYSISKWRGLSNQMYGNAIHTHVFNNILLTIEEYETKTRV